MVNELFSPMDEKLTNKVKELVELILEYTGGVRYVRWVDEFTAQCDACRAVSLNGSLHHAKGCPIIRMYALALELRPAILPSVNHRP